MPSEGRVVVEFVGKNFTVEVNGENVANGVASFVKLRGVSGSVGIGNRPSKGHVCRVKNIKFEEMV